MNQVSSVEKGRLAENRALDYLTDSGLRLITRNYRCPLGEVDLIMMDQNTTVFIEVRSLKNTRTMNVVETIDIKKQKRIIQTSEHYLQVNSKKNNPYCRFDVICITGSIESANIEWIKDAFYA